MCKSSKIVENDLTKRIYWIWSAQYFNQNCLSLDFCDITLIFLDRLYLKRNYHPLSMKWYHISLLLCVFGFLKEIRPSEPFVSDYMQQPYRNVTEEQVSFPNFKENFNYFKWFEISKIKTLKFIYFLAKSWYLPNCNLFNRRTFTFSIVSNRLVKVKSIEMNSKYFKVNAFFSFKPNFCFADISRSLYWQVCRES